MPKLVITADLHYDITRSQEPTRAVAEQICRLDADALLVLGDVAGRNPAGVGECLHLFDGFAGAKFFVAGNHDVWTEPGESSLERFEKVLPWLCREAGFHPLDIEPAELDGVGLVGSMGWYDYSFAAAELGIPVRFYQAKIAPGAAERLPGYEHLLTDRTDVPESAFELGTRWMDGQYVRLPMSDEAFCERLMTRLESHLEWASRTCREVVVGLHHVPFRELIPHGREARFAFSSAYMGCERLGEVLLRYPKVSHAYCGHTHYLARTQRGSLNCINVGCTYVEKRYEMLEI